MYYPKLFPIKFTQHCMLHTVGCRYNTFQNITILHRTLWWLEQTIYQSLNLQYTPHNSPFTGELWGDYREEYLATYNDTTLNLPVGAVLLTGMGIPSGWPTWWRPLVSPPHPSWSNSPPALDLSAEQPRTFHCDFVICIPAISALVASFLRIYGSGHGTGAVLLPGFAINW